MIDGPTYLYPGTHTAKFHRNVRNKVYNTNYYSSDGSFEDIDDIVGHDLNTKAVRRQYESSNEHEFDPQPLCVLLQPG